MNRHFGQLNDGEIEYAPENLYIGNTIYFAPTAEQYKSQGWLPVITDNQPTGKVGVYYTPSGWKQENDTIARTWEEHPIEAPVIVNRYSKLKVITAAKKDGKWDALKSFISQAGYEDEWNACMYLADDYEGFDLIIDSIVSAGIATKAEIDAILEEAKDDSLRL